MERVIGSVNTKRMSFLRFLLVSGALASGVGYYGFQRHDSTRAINVLLLPDCNLQRASLAVLQQYCPKASQALEPVRAEMLRTKFYTQPTLVENFNLPITSVKNGKFPQFKKLPQEMDSDEWAKWERTSADSTTPSLNETLEPLSEIPQEPLSKTMMTQPTETELNDPWAEWKWEEANNSESTWDRQEEKDDRSLNSAGKGDRQRAR